MRVQHQAVILGCLALLTSVRSFFVSVDANAEECFHERVQQAGSKLVLTFEVAEGGFLDIDVNVSSIYNGPLVLTMSNYGESD